MADNLIYHPVSTTELQALDGNSEALVSEKKLSDTEAMKRINHRKSG